MKNGKVFWLGLLTTILALGFSTLHAAEVFNDGFEAGKTFGDNNWDSSASVSWALSFSGYGNPQNYAWGGGGSTTRENLVSGTIAKNTGYVIQANDLLTLQVDVRNMTNIVRDSSLLATLYYMDGDQKMIIGSGEIFEGDLPPSVWTEDLIPIIAKVPLAAVGKNLYVSFAGGPNSWNGTSAQRLGIDNVIISQTESLKALNVSPANGAEEIATGSSINWECARDKANPSQPAPAIEELQVWIGTDPNLVLVATLAAGTETYQPELVTDTTYFWRIDTIVPDPNGSITGDVWSFSTTRTLADIVQQPQDTFVFEGQTATISLVATSQTPSGYAWYKGEPGDTSVSIGTNSPVLTLENVTMADETSYWCQITNSAGTADSEAATLYIKRMLGHWKLDGDLTNALGDGYDGTMVDPNFAEGIDGSAVNLMADGRFVTIADSEDYFNTPSFTVTCFVKSGSTASLSAILSKRETTAGQIGWFMYTQSGAASGELEGIGILTGTNILGTKWHMITMEFDSLALEFRLYVDGVLAGTQAANGPFVHSGSPLIFGTASPISTAYFTGLVDDVRFYNYSLSAREIAEIYHDFTGESFCYANPQFDVTGPEGTPDCVVDLFDLAAFTVSWLECNMMPETDCN